MRTYSPEEQRNRDVAIDFYTHAILNWDFDAAAHHIGPTYVQHNPNVADGAEGFKAFIDYVKGRFGKPRSQIRRVIVDDDIVILHIDTHPSADRQLAIMDIPLRERQARRALGRDPAGAGRVEERQHDVLGGAAAPRAAQRP